MRAGSEDDIHEDDMHDQLTLLLNAATSGEPDDLDRLWSTIHSEVREMARTACRNEAPRTQLQPTLLVNELYLKMFGPDAMPPAWDDRRHFWGSVSRAMSQFLVDLARSESRLKRGGDRARVPLHIVAGELQDLTRAISPLSIAALEELDRLERESPESAHVARLRFLSGLSVEETAELLEIAPRTVSKRWRFARAWLRRAVAEAS